MKTLPTCLLVLCLTSPGGCTISRQVEGLEAQLRSQEDEIQRLASDLNRIQLDLQASRQEANQLRGQLAEGGASTIPAEQAEIFYRLSGVVIDRYQTSYLPGEKGGEGMLAVLVTPVDQLQTALRLPGDIEVQVFDRSENSAPIATQKFPASAVQQQWTAGWTTSGFLVQLPLQLKDVSAIQPTGGTSASPAEVGLKIVATFRALDGREFKTSQNLPVPVSAERSGTQIEPASLEQQVPIPPEFRQTAAPPSPMDVSSRTDTSDRRTIDEYPVLR